MLGSKLVCRSAGALSALACALVTTFSTANLQAQEVIRFGAPLPLTGALAPEALKQQQGYDLWAEQVNKSGGIKVGGKKMKVEIVYTDYQSTTPRAVQTAEKLIAELKRRGYQVVTEVVKASTFYPAEPYHQDYLDKHPERACHPRVERFGPAKTKAPKST